MYFYPIMSFLSWPIIQSDKQTFAPWLLSAYVFTTLFQIAIYLIFRFLYTRITHPSIPGKAVTSVTTLPLPPCTVLICSRNEAENLARHLPEILEQTYTGTFEVLVVNDASRDDSMLVLEKLGKKYAHLKVLNLSKKDGPGKKNALTRGIVVAKYDHLLLTDADCRPASALWLANMMEVLCAKPETEIVLGYGPTISEAGFLNKWARFETLNTAVQYLSFAAAGFAYMGVGRNLSWKKKTFERANGFAEHLDLASGDDDLFVNQAAAKTNVALCVTPESFMYSRGKNEWTQWFRQKKRHLSTGTRYRPVHRILLGSIALTHVLHYTLLLILLFYGFQTGAVFSFYLLRLISVRIALQKFMRHLGESDLRSLIPLYDFVMALYYGTFVPLSLLQKSDLKSWK